MVIELQLKGEYRKRLNNTLEMHSLLNILKVVRDYSNVALLK